MRSTAELREGFLEFFESKEHKRHPSASLIPRPDDRSTLLNSAGMQPLMPYFLGREEPPAPLLTTVQKCFRSPDIDEVGLDGYHLTFFEMLGNFSFGQYFKEGAIELAWEFVFDQLKFDAERVWVSVFAGDPELGLGEDESAANLWKQIGMPPERIVRLGREHNFWWVGGPGPCGPDTELFYDRGEGLGCGRAECAPGCECERFLEFWNLVFMEYELKSDGSVTPLPTQNVDTGMGLERTAAILQDVISVYETDGYQAIMDWIEAESGVAWQSSEKATKAHRIIADHGRGMTFLVADGVLPSNEGRGYVLRRVIRRAVQQARGIGLADLWRISDVVADQMSAWYPELDENRERIRDALKAEEERFSQTLERGLGLFEEIASGDFISGDDAFKLHDTYGFPLELTRELAGDRGLAVDEEEFSRLMAEQRARSKTKTAEAAIAVDGSRPTEFVGYETTEVLTAILAYQALRDLLGERVRQAGSAVRPDKLRFDFTYDRALTPEEREQVERAVNEKVFQNLPVRTFVTPIEEARKLGAMMLFGEKYGEEVRVVEVDGYSRELCGGTHVRSTAEIGPFVILSESSIGAGTRRVEAITAGEGFSHLASRARRT